LIIFSYEIQTILWSNVLFLTFECQAWIKIVDIKQKYLSKFFLKCVIFRSKILQKLRIFPKWALWMRHQESLVKLSMLLDLLLSVTYNFRDFSLLYLPLHEKWGGSLAELVITLVICTKEPRYKIAGVAKNLVSCFKLQIPCVNNPKLT
jgi:hypothetical protein